jgi:hypothetical protein
VSVGGAAAISSPVATERSTGFPLERLLPWLACIVVFAVGALAIDGQPVGVLRDDSMYVELAKSIATGHGYRWLNLPGTPAATHFPPGYPVVLALLWTLAPSFPANVLLFKLANTAFAAITAFGVGRLVRSRFGLPTLGAQLFAVAAMVAIPMLTLATQVMSEPLFLAMLVLTILLAERVLERSEVPWMRVVGLGLAAGATTLVRSNGVALLPAIALLLFARRRYKDAAIFAVTMIAVLLPWQLWAGAHANAVPAPMRGNYEPYTTLLVDAVRTRGLGFFAAVAGRTSGEIATMLQYTVAPTGIATVRILALMVFALLAAVGARSMWRRAPVSTAFLAVYALIVVFWPYTPGRFVWCVWPFILLLPVLGTRTLWTWRPGPGRARLTRFAVLAGAASLAFGYTVYNARGYRAGAWAAQGYGERLQPLLVHVASRTPPNALIASESENTVYLYTGRQTVPIGSFMATDYLRPRSSSEMADGFASILERYHPAVVVVSSRYLRAAASELAERQPPVLALVDSFPGGGLTFAPVRR